LSVHLEAVEAGRSGIRKPESVEPFLCDVSLSPSTESFLSELPRNEDPDSVGVEVLKASLPSDRNWRYAAFNNVKSSMTHHMLHSPEPNAACPDLLDGLESSPDVQRNLQIAY
jgi:hypothetical protein